MSIQSGSSARGSSARALASATIVLLWAASASAGHHRWDFTEIFSNADGSVQFIEMFSANSGESGLGPWTITAGGNTFNFVTNLPGDSANTWVLVATADFASLPGAPTPDYVMPASFFPTGGGTLVYAGGSDTWSYGPVPTNGIASLERDGSTPPNSPTNFAGVTGSVNASGAPIPSLAAWAAMVLVAVVLLAGSGMLRRRGPATAS